MYYQVECGMEELVEKDGHMEGEGATGEEEAIKVAAAAGVATAPCASVSDEAAKRVPPKQNDSIAPT